MTYQIDTNILIRLFLRDNEEQVSKIESTIERLLSANHSLFVDPLVIIEFLFVTSGKIYQIDREKSVHFLLVFLQNKQILTINKSTLQSALKLFTKHSLDFADCYLFAQAKGLSHKILSFDSAFDKLDPKIRTKP